MSHVSRDTRIGLLLAGLVLVVAIPGAAMGSGFLREDWLEIGRLQHCAFVTCPGAEIHNRPVMEILWAVQFTLFRSHPAATYWLLNLSLAVTAMFLYRLARHFLSRGESAGVVALWAVLPTHLALQHWASVMHNVLALMLCIIGVERIYRHPDRRAIALLVASVAIYESTAPFAIVAIILAPRIRAHLGGKSPDALHAASRDYTRWATGIVTALATLIVLVQLHRRRQELVNPVDILWSNFGFYAYGNRFCICLALFATVAATVGVVRLLIPKRRAVAGKPEWMIAVGLSIMVIGSLPFLTSDFDSMFESLGDRANQLAAIGGAIAWVGIINITRRRQFALPVLAGLLGIGIPLHIQRDARYASVVTTTQRLVVKINQLTPPGQHELTVVSRESAEYRELSTSLTQEVELGAYAGKRSIRVHFVEPAVGAAKGVPDPLAGPGRS